MAGKTEVIAKKNGKLVDIDIDEALEMKKSLDEEMIKNMQNFILYNKDLQYS